VLLPPLALSVMLATEAPAFIIIATAIKCPAPVAGIERLVIGLPPFDVMFTMAQPVLLVNVAVGLRLLFTTKLHGLPPVQGPLHPEKVQLFPAVAFSVTGLPLG
jgi:hypothetical protein